MKAKFRTPRKILSVFLCILMLTTSVVIANPFTASAASTVTWKPKAAGGELEFRHHSSGAAVYGYNYDLFEDGYDDDRGDFSWVDDPDSEPDEDGNYDRMPLYDDEAIYGVHRNSLLYIYSIYDYNPNAVNPDTYVQTDIPDKVEIGTIDEIVGYDEDDSPEYETRKVYMSAGVDYDKVCGLFGNNDFALSAADRCCCCNLGNLEDRGNVHV